MTGVLPWRQLLQAEIQDETDTWQQEEGGSRRGPRRVELERYLSMFEHKIAAGKALSPQEIQAVASFLSASVQEFAGLASSNVALKASPLLILSEPNLNVCAGRSA